MPHWSRDDLVFEKNKYCDRCGWIYHKNELVMQKGKWLCPFCRDEINPHPDRGDKVMG